MEVYDTGAQCVPVSDDCVGHECCPSLFQPILDPLIELVEVGLRCRISLLLQELRGSIAEDRYAESLDDRLEFFLL